MNHKGQGSAVTAAVFLLLLPLTATAAPIVRSGVTEGGATDPAFLSLIDTFRADLGGGLPNPPGACTPTPCTTGRREINWDGVPAGQSSPNNFNGSFFAGTAGVEPAGRQRGAAFTTPGSGFRVSATEFSDETTFGPDEFAVFSPARLFGTLGSNITDVTFSVPGDPTTAATTRGFGVVFTDVDYTGSTSIEFFDGTGALLGLFDVPGVLPAPVGQNTQGSFSFLGVSFDAGERVGRVRIRAGSKGLDENFVGIDDAVAMDDFIYGEPIAHRVPAPAAFGLLAIALGGLTLRRRT